MGWPVSGPSRCWRSSSRRSACYRVEARSPDLRNTSGIPRNAMLPHVVTNWKVARDAETQTLRRRVNLLLLADAAGFALLCLWIWWVRQG